MQQTTAIMLQEDELKLILESLNENETHATNNIYKSRRIEALKVIIKQTIKCF